MYVYRLQTVLEKLDINMQKMNLGTELSSFTKFISK